LQDKLFELVKNNLYVGLIVKNYKLMCHLLQQEQKISGQGKNYQFDQWKQYFNWEK